MHHVHIRFMWLDLTTKTIAEVSNVKSASSFTLHIMNKFILTFCVILLAASSCDDDRVSMSANRYLPLGVGNYWEFVTLNALPNDNMVIEHREVVGMETIDKVQYFTVVSTWPPSSSVPSDTVYYRIEANGYVYKRRKGDGGEIQEFRLNADDGDSWSFIYYDYNTIVSCEKIDIDLGSESVRNCKSYYRDVEQMADEEFTYVLAPRIGFAVEYSNAWGGGQRLKRAKVNGTTYSF